MRHTPRRPRPAVESRQHTRLRRAAGRDGNPLRRPIDRARTRLAICMVPVTMLALALAATAASTLYSCQQRAAAQIAPHRHRIAAIALASPPKNGVWSSGKVQVPARWQYPADQFHTAQVQAPAGTNPGSQVAVWVDDSGHRSAAPRTAADIIANAIATGLAALIGASLIGGSTYLLVRRRIDACAAAAWEQDWERVEPRWSGRSRTT